MPKDKIDSKVFTYSNEGSLGGKNKIKSREVKREKEYIYNPGKWIISLNDNNEHY